MSCLRDTIDFIRLLQRVAQWLGARDPAYAFSRAFIPPCNPLPEEVDTSRTRHRDAHVAAATGTLDIYWVCVPDPGFFNRGSQALNWLEQAPCQHDMARIPWRIVPIVACKSRCAILVRRVVAAEKVLPRHGPAPTCPIRTSAPPRDDLDFQLDSALHRDSQWVQTCLVY
jgi:hypothetical protein